MRDFVAIQWQRACRTLASAKQLVDSDGDSAASRAYFAAFHGLTALFALRGQSFSKHSAVRAALHRELVHSGQWSSELGNAFDFLMDLRETGDYGGLTQVSSDTAKMAVTKAEDILDAVKQTCPELAP